MSQEIIDKLINEITSWVYKQDPVTVTDKQCRDKFPNNFEQLKNEGYTLEIIRKKIPMQGLIPDKIEVQCEVNYKKK